MSKDKDTELKNSYVKTTLTFQNLESYYNYENDGNGKFLTTILSGLDKKIVAENSGSNEPDEDNNYNYVPAEIVIHPTFALIPSAYKTLHSKMIRIEAALVRANQTENENNLDNSQIVDFVLPIYCFDGIKNSKFIK